MVEDNKHIDDFLESYCKLQSPQYAVMLKGKWGSGKTHYINKLDIVNKKYIYVSLYGVKTNSEILSKILKNDIFQKIDEKIKNEKVIQSISLFKEIVSDKLISNKIISNEVLQMQILESYNDLAKCIFIFDDLERCEAPINKILGFINIFVEHKNSKVIILANEEELDKNNQDYQKIKEKLIGKTFDIVSEVDLAYKHFIDKLDKSDNEIFTKYDVIIKDIYKKSKCNNLRILRQIILDFYRFYNLVLKKYQKVDFIKDFIQIYFILSFEYKNNELDILKMKEDYPWDGTYSNENKETKIETISQKLNSKYTFDIDSSKILTLELWHDILDKSQINTKDIEEAILSSKYYVDENSPNWKRLWHFKKLEDDKLEPLAKDVYKELSKSKLNNIFEVLHVCSTLLYLNSKNLIKYEDDKILDISKKHLDYLYENKKIDSSSYKNKESILSNDVWETLQYVESKNHYFIELRKYLKYIFEKGTQDRINEDRNKIIKFIVYDDDSLYSMFYRNNLDKNLYFNKPILKDINIDNFIEQIKKEKQYKMNCFGLVLKERYIEKVYNKELMSEIDFLNNLNEKLTILQKERENKISGYNLSYFLEDLQKSIKDLQQYIDDTKGINNEI